MPLFTQEKQHIPSNLLKDKYGWPPFSILNTITSDWQKRKREWENIIGDSTLGRDVKRYNATPTNIFSSRGIDAKEANSISEFDPHLAELMYRWFSRPGDKILDPFAGGCTRGLVASILDRDYTGLDLSDAQIQANNDSMYILSSRYINTLKNAKYCVTDTYNYIDTLTDSYNMMFTCPPYYNLERYSTNPNDLSNLPTYEEFLKRMQHIIDGVYRVLEDDSFAVIVVSEVRAEVRGMTNSYYLGLVPDTINMFRASGFKYYNEIILENNIGSLPVRAPKFFRRSRKIGRHHQNILVFYKGDLAHIEDKFAHIEI